MGGMAMQRNIEAACLPPLLDIQDNGMGDVVLACWLVASALACGLQLQVNPRRWRDLPALLGMPASAVTERNGPSATKTESIGLRYEYGKVHADLAAGRIPESRFALWAASLGLTTMEHPKFRAVRPTYIPDAAADDWATSQWQKPESSRVRPRVLLFPDSARNTRRWPAAQFQDLARMLKADGWAVAALAGSREAAAAPGCRYWFGYDIARVAALVAQADLVIANDTGPAHLAGTIGTPTLAICGPTIGAVVFGHDPNVTVLHPAGTDVPSCAPCHFSAARGYRPHCQSAGCAALAALDGSGVREAARQILAVRLHGQSGDPRRAEHPALEGNC